MIAPLAGWDHPYPQGQQDAEQSRRLETLNNEFGACSVSVVSNEMEAAMFKRLATIAGTLAIFAAALLVPGRADAGASASAPSKYGHTSQVATVHQVQSNRQARSTHLLITEYSSSSAKTSTPKR